MSNFDKAFEVDIDNGIIFNLQQENFSKISYH